MALKDDLLDSRGYFWWGDEPQPKRGFWPGTAVAGALKIAASGLIRLSLDAPLSSMSKGEFIMSILNREPITRPICGVLHGSNKYVRLTDIERDGANANFEGPSNEAMLAGCCLIGIKPFSATKEPQFGSIEMSLEGYEEWLHLRSINVVKTRRSVTARYIGPADRAWALSAGKLKLTYDLSQPAPGRRSKLFLKEIPRLRFSRNQKFTVDEAMRLSVRLEDLIILLTDSERGLDFPTLRDRRNGSPISIFYRRAQRLEKEFDLFRCWAPFPRIADHFGTIVEGWLTKHQFFGPGFHLYVGNRRRIQLYPEHRFASLVWGLEALHRRNTAPKVNSALGAKITRILGQIGDAKDRNWAGLQLKNAGEPNLASRIFDLVNTLPLGLDTRELQAFANRSADRRNDLAHFGGMRQPGQYETFLEDVLRLSETLDLFYHAKLLQEVGVPDAEVRRWFLDGPCAEEIRSTLADVGLSLPMSGRASTKPKSDKAQRLP